MSCSSRYSLFCCQPSIEWHSIVGLEMESSQFYNILWLRLFPWHMTIKHAKNICCVKLDLLPSCVVVQKSLDWKKAIKGHVCSYILVLKCRPISDIYRFSELIHKTDWCCIQWQVWELNWERRYIWFLSFTWKVRTKSISHTDEENYIYRNLQWIKINCCQSS